MASITLATGKLTSSLAPSAVTVAPSSSSPVLSASDSASAAALRFDSAAPFSLSALVYRSSVGLQLVPLGRRLLGRAALALQLGLPRADGVLHLLIRDQVHVAGEAEPGERDREPEELLPTSTGAGLSGRHGVLEGVAGHSRRNIPLFPTS